MKTISSILIGLAAVTDAAASSKMLELKAQGEFKNFMKKYNKEYSTDEIFERYNTFKDNLAKINAHDEDFHGYSLGVNQFADLSVEEFRNNYLGFKPIQRNYQKSLNLHVEPEGEVLADSLDWVQKGAVTPVKDQGQCGGCWAFSTTGSIEGAHQIATGDLVSLSEQQLMDCSTPEGNNGCNGGLMDYGFEYVIENGLTTESSYPYTASDGTCRTDVTTAVSISGFKDVDAQSETALMSALQIGPVSIAIDADENFQLYKKGVFRSKCEHNLDHGILLVGYGSTKPGPKGRTAKYWKVKNSWGTSWGEDGYIRLKRGVDECGLADAASYAVVGDAKPSAPAAEKEWTYMDAKPSAPAAEKEWTYMA